MTDQFEHSVETYDIEDELGRDDLTIAYSARRESDGTQVLVRVVAPQFIFDTYFIKRFKDAVTRSMQLDHPNIVKIFEVAEKDDIVYLVREWVDADSLAQYLEKHGPIPVVQTLDFIEQLASALDYAHTQGFKHGDLSDGSIFVSDDHIWVSDFGLLMAMDGTSLVKKGFGVGNPAYLSPERVRGEGSSRISDMYALGIICYQMLTGQPPFTGAAPAILHAQAYEQPTPLHELNRKVSRSVSDVVLRMLSKGLELRYNTGAEFVAALTAAAEGTGPVRRQRRKTGPQEPIRQPAKPALSKNFAIWLFVLTPLIGLALAAGFWVANRWLPAWQATVLDQPTQVAQQVEAPTTNLTPLPLLKDVQSLVQPTSTQEAPAAENISGTSENDQPAIGGPTEPSTPTPTLVPAALESALSSEPVVVAGSPFTNLVLAKNITDNYQPLEPANIFPPTEDPVYLFFDYQTIQIGTSWRHIWKWDDVVLQASDDLWPDEYGSIGTAWIYFAPANGFNPGPYSVSLEVDGQIVAVIDFIVQAGN